MKAYGYVGLIIILLAEILLFTGSQVVGRWFTPIVWTGYILLLDALVFRATRRSLVTLDRLELLLIALISIACWWLFEFYNAPRFWTSDLELWWHYHNLEPNPYLRRAGYDWAFATIFPAMFLTAQFLAVTIFRRANIARPIRFPRWVLYLLIVLGALTAIVPLLFISIWLVPVVWLSFVFLLDPINYFRGQPSIIRDLEQGNYRRILALLAAGGICGLLWEFWNYWAISKWTYTVPFLPGIKIFEMPVLGYFGFPPFAVECWVMYIFLRSLITARRIDLDDTNIWVSN
jgi:hypothetical protein